MKTRAHTMMRLQVQHDYYLNGLWKGLSWVVAESSAAVMASQRMRVQAVPGGMSLARTVYEVGGNVLPGRSQGTVQVRLLMVPGDAYHLNYTALPQHDLRREVLYFSNLDREGKPRAAFLSVEERVSGADFLPLMSPNGNWPTTAKPSTKATVRNHVGEVVQETAVAEEGWVQLNLAHLDFGRFEISIEGQAPQSFVTAEQWGSRPAAILDLYLDVAAAAWNGQEVAQYKLHFAAREIFWRYNVQLGRRNGVNQILEVKDPDQTLSFRPGTVVMVDEQPQIHILSEAPVRLQERYPFSLELMQSATQTVLATRLPFPDFRNFKQHPALAGEYLAESFVAL
ncbi:MAG: hypothetical protein U0176_24060 [Bacteroidia bacterium]